MKPSNFHPRPSRMACAATAFLALVGAVILPAQSDIDITGYWAFHVKDGGVPGRLPENGRSSAEDRPPDRLQPLPVRLARRLEVGRRKAKKSVSPGNGFWGLRDAA